MLSVENDAVVIAEGTGPECEGLGVLYTVAEVARALRLHPKTLYRMCGTGVIEHTRIGRHVRFSRAQYAEFLARMTVEPVAEGGE